MGSNSKSINNKFANWSYEKKLKGKNNPNLRPTYFISVKGKIRLNSPAGCLIIVGLLILGLGSVLTYFAPKVNYGPIGVGIGIFTLIIAFTLLLEDRDSSKKLININDIYVKFVVDGAKLDKKASLKSKMNLTIKQPNRKLRRRSTID